MKKTLPRKRHLANLLRSSDVPLRQFIRNCGRPKGVRSPMKRTVSSTIERTLFERIETLFNEHVDAVYNVAYRVLWNRDDAEDVVQATFVKAFLRLDQLKDDSKVRAWLLQVGYREAITVVRRRRDVPTDPLEMPVEASNARGPEALAVASAMAGHISEALMAMDEDERVAVVLRDIEELPMRQVAEVLDVGLSAAKMRVHRGRQSLRQKLEHLEVL